MNRYYYIFSKNANDFYHTTVFYSIITQGILQTHLIQKKKLILVVMKFFLEIWLQIWRKILVNICIQLLLFLFWSLYWSLYEREEFWRSYYYFIWRFKQGNCVSFKIKFYFSKLFDMYNVICGFTVQILTIH